MKRTLMFLLLLAVSASLSAQYLLECAADLHVSRKGDYFNGTTSLTDSGVWEWEIGSGNTYSNIQAITALGLFHATKSLGNTEYAIETFDTTNLIVGRYNNDLVTRPYAPEVDLLMNACEFDPMSSFLAKAPEDAGYCAIASSLYARVVGDYPSSAGNADRYIDNRGSLAGWDIAWHIRAAWRSGFHSYALGMIEQTLARRADWEHVLYGGWDYTNISQSALAWVIIEMYNAGDTNSLDYSEAVLMNQGLVAVQEVNGSWEDDPQVTAYVLLGLREDVINFSAWHPNVVRGENYLRNSAVPGGCGWSYPPEIGEVNSEVIMALSLINSLPFIDGFESGDTFAWSGQVGFPLAPPALAPIRSARMPSIQPLR